MDPSPLTPSSPAAAAPFPGCHEGFSHDLGMPHRECLGLGGVDCFRKSMVLLGGTRGLRLQTHRGDLQEQPPSFPFSLGSTCLLGP